MYRHFSYPCHIDRLSEVEIRVSGIFLPLPLSGLMEVRCNGLIEILGLTESIFVKRVAQDGPRQSSRHLEFVALSESAVIKIQAAVNEGQYVADDRVYRQPGPMTLCSGEIGLACRPSRFKCHHGGRMNSPFVDDLFMASSLVSATRRELGTTQSRQNQNPRMLTSFKEMATLGRRKY